MIQATAVQPETVQADDDIEGLHKGGNTACAQGRSHSGKHTGESSLNGNRTRISALRGPRPRPLDDKARSALPRKDSNLDKQIQSLLSCH